MKTRTQSLRMADTDRLGEIQNEQPAQAKLRIIFGPSELMRKGEVNRALAALPKDVFVVGCSTAGEIFNNEVKDQSISVADLSFAATQLKQASCEIRNPAESQAAGRKLAQALMGPGLKGVLVFSDGLSVNGTDLLVGLNSILDKTVVVTGGLAADGADFKSTWVVSDRELKTGFVSALGFYGDHIQLRHGSQGGWDIFGPERTITKAEGNILYEIDNQPALDLYKKYLGAKASDLPGSALLFPIKIWQPGQEFSAVVRTILGVNEENSSMTFAGNMPVGYSAQLMRANFDRLIEGAATAANGLHASEAGFSLAISCVGRKLVLGERVEEEVSAVANRLPVGAQQVGFYSYGEISPLISGDRCHLHNQTMTLTYISEGELKNAG